MLQTSSGATAPLASDAASLVLIFLVLLTVAAPEKQQIPDGEQAPTCAAGEERHESNAGLCGERRFLVLHSALLQAAVPGRQRG